jgi:hypothetical protein
MKAFSCINKYKQHIALFISIVLIILVSMNYEKIIEGFTSCTQANANCSTCINAKVTDSSSPCYWNKEKQECGSFSDNGYSSTCPSCTYYIDCSSCIKNGCYWDASTNICGSDLSGNYTSTCPPPLLCTSFTDCSSCTSHDNCYWNSNDKKCKLNGGSGYARVCDNNNNKCGEFIKLPFDTYMQSSNS